MLVPLFSAASVGYDGTQGMLSNSICTGDSDGNDILGSMMNGLQTLPQWRNYFHKPEGAMLGLVNAVYPLGKVVALILVTFVCDKYGRKFPLYIGFAGAIGFALLQGFAKNLPMFITARALLGFFTSFLSQPSPILITELAYPTQRGKFTALYQTSYVSSLPFAQAPAARLARLATNITLLVFRCHLRRLVNVRHL
jgi:MFS family permease